MRCPELERLIADYQRAVRAYRIAVLKLTDKHGEEFLDEAREVERPQLLARRAYEALQRHQRMHGCGHDLETRPSG